MTPDHRPRVRVTLPGDQGAITVRLTAWILREHGGWEAIIAWERWAATHPAEIGGPIVTQSMGDYMSVPRALVEPIEGEDYSAVERRHEQRRVRRRADTGDETGVSLGERVDRMRRG